MQPNICYMHTYIRTAVKFVFTQMHATKGFNFFGENTLVAIIKQLKQLYKLSIPGKIVIASIKADTLTDEDKAKYSDAVYLIKEK